MQPSEWLRSRAKAFRQDQTHLSRQIDVYRGENTDKVLMEMKDRYRGYGVIAMELTTLADEMERDGR